MSALHDWSVDGMDHTITSCADGIPSDFWAREDKRRVGREVAQVSVIAVVVVPVLQDVDHGVSDVG